MTRRRFISQMARKENWRQEEISALVDCVADRIDIIKGKFSPFLTTDKKAKAWDEVLESVNACSFTQRDVKSIKKKWIDIQSKTRKREAERRRDQKKTGGGPPPADLKPWEDKIISVLDDSMVVGIEGGFDTSECGNNEFPRATSHDVSNYISAHASKTKELVPETIPPSFAGDTSMPPDCSTKSRKRKITMETADNPKADNLLKIQKEKLELKKELLEIEKKKLDVLKEICFELKRKKLLLLIFFSNS
ncbi:nuclear apoptosis-inducing factor 1-like [Saccostrea echinata]|uniref:nuclear apoptosis-inducing factor 1-like n=1 Tax=Saccostrea echinata TaxID=191078 RepID=UPI002A824781|nr:nuclear apoptosis-inducing factor 1-like [Saccostrea echinata]XP_061179627.1 nuclear apoptosis-inducing factor 1-like [Saccostrea echinata]